MATETKPRPGPDIEKFKADLRAMRQRAEYGEAQAEYWKRQSMEIRTVAAEACAILSAVQEAINGHRAEGRNDEQGV